MTQRRHDDWEWRESITGSQGVAVRELDSKARRAQEASRTPRHQGVKGAAVGACLAAIWVGAYALGDVARAIA